MFEVGCYGGAVARAFPLYFALFSRRHPILHFHGTGYCELMQQKLALPICAQCPAYRSASGVAAQQTQVVFVDWHCRIWRGGVPFSTDGRNTREWLRPTLRPFRTC
jgi:hypothetical protein